MKRSLLSLVLIFISLHSFAQVLYTNDFTGGSAGWTLGQGGNLDTWTVNNVYNCASTTPNQGGGNYMHIYDDIWPELCAHCGFYGSGSSGIVYATQNSDISTIGYSTVTITFDWLCQGQTGPVLPSYGTLWYSTNMGGAWTQLTPLQYNGQPTWTTAVVNSAAMGNQSTVRIRFGWNNSGYGTNPAFAIDNLTITGTVGGCTNVGGTSSALPSTICSGNTSVLTVGGSSGSIQWEQSPDGISSWVNVTGGSGATTPTYTTPALTTTTYYRAKLSQATCPDVYSTVSSVTVNPNVAASVSINANPSGPICEGTNVLFTATPTGGGTSPTYEWFLNTNPVGTGASYSNNNLANSDQIVCIMTSNASCVTGSPAISNTIAMTVNPNPVATITPPGPITFCDDTTIILYCGPVGNYMWNNGSTANNTPATSSGNWCVTVVDANGCSDTACVLVTINPTPNVSINGNDTICVGDIATLTASGANSYVWSTSQTINPITVSPGGPTTYTVTGTENVNFCTATASFTVIPLPNTIDNSLSSLSAISLHANQNAATYQWIDCNNGNLPLSGETGQDFTATVNGSYAVIITMAGCSDTSVCLSINSIGIDEFIVNEISIYPNPSNGTFTIQAPWNGIYEISDGFGKIIKSFELNDVNGYTIRIDGISNGVYFIEGKTEKGSVRQKIIITN